MYCKPYRHWLNITANNSIFRLLPYRYLMEKPPQKNWFMQYLSTTYKTYTTEGNLNNHIGVPLTILKIKERCGNGRY